MTDPPAATYTFVFTDIEGSTKLLRELGDEYPRVLSEHDALVGAAAAEHGGRSFGSEGDAQYLVFDDALSAIRAAAAAQRALADHAWPGGVAVRVRMGIHSGVAQAKGDNFVGLTLHEAARIAAAGHGGQVLLSPSTRALVAGTMPDGISLADLGAYRLKDMPEPVRIAQLQIDDLQQEFDALRAQPEARVVLPTQLTSFVGRKEVDEVAALVEQARLITLTGPGGTGKTRLSIEVAAHVAPAFADGTHFVALDAVVDPELVMSEVAAALSVTATSGAPVDAVIKHLAEREALLVLDNLEQVLAAAPQIARLLRECPAVRIIASSRIPLGIGGEQEFPVPALSMPGSTERIDAASADRFEAVRLFAERASAVRPGFELNDETAPIVVDICRHLDGLPLAIELAAARVRMLTLGDLRDRLERDIGILSSRDRDVPERQRALRAAIAWSHDLLDAPDQRLFARFSVMMGAVTLDTAESICGPEAELGRSVWEGLESLAYQSLVRMVEDGQSRFAMLVTIRGFAGEMLVASDEAEEIRRRHALTFLGLAEEAAPHLTGPDGPGWNDRLELEHDNLRAAIDWSVERREVEIALRLVTALWRFWQVRGHLFDAKERFDRVLALAADTSPPAELMARAEGAAGSVAYWLSEQDDTHRHYAAALRYAREAGDEPILAEALYNLSFAPSDPEEPLSEQAAEARGYLDEALEIYRRLDDREGIASALWALSQPAAYLDDHESFERIVTESLELSRDLGDPFRTGWAAFELGSNRLRIDQTDAALDPIEEAFEIFAKVRDAGGLTLSLAMLSILAIRQQDPDGWRLWGAQSRLEETTGTDRWSGDPRAASMRPEASTEDELSAYEEGRRMSQDEAIELGRLVLGRLRAAAEARAG